MSFFEKYDIPLHPNEKGDSSVQITISSEEEGFHVAQTVTHHPSASSIDDKFTFVPGHDAYDTSHVYRFTTEQMRDMTVFSTSNSSSKNRLLEQIATTNSQKIEFWTISPMLQRACQSYAETTGLH